MEDWRKPEILLRKQVLHKKKSRESTLACDSESIQHFNTPAAPVCVSPSDTSSFTVLTLTDLEARHGQCQS